MKGNFLLRCSCFNMYTMSFPLPAEASDGYLGTKAQTNVLPGEPLGAAGGFGDAEVAQEPRGAATQHALNSKLFLFPGLVCYQFITFIYNNL